MTGARVVIADDSEDARMLLRLTLEMGGELDVVGEARDGLEAVQLCEELRPDVLVMDLSMPRLSGLDALPRLHEAAPGCRVIVLSSYDRGAMAAQVLAAGAARYVEKGLPFGELARVIDEVLAEPA